MEIQCGVSILQTLLNTSNCAVKLVNQYIVLFAGRVSGIEHLWVIGDRFCFDTMAFHLMTMPEEESYIRRNFDVGNYSSCLFASNDNNILSRLINQLNRAFIENKVLPKLILMIIEDDIIKVLAHRHESQKCRAEPKYSKEVNWLLKETAKAVSIFKDFLPKRAQREKYPHICWIQPVTNIHFYNNKEREHFGDKLKKFIPLYNNMSTLKLVQVWDIYDRSLYLGPQRRFTHEGKVQYWRAVDKTVRFCDTNILKKFGQNEGLNSFQKNTGKFNKQNWRRKGKNTSHWTKPHQEHQDMGEHASSEKARRYHHHLQPRDIHQMNLIKWLFSCSNHIVFNYLFFQFSLLFINLFGATSMFFGYYLSIS